MRKWAVDDRLFSTDAFEKYMFELTMEFHESQIYSGEKHLPTITQPNFDRDSWIISITEKLLNYYAQFYDDLPEWPARDRVRYGFCIPTAYALLKVTKGLTPVYGRAWSGHGRNENHVWLRNNDHEFIDPIGWQWEHEPTAYKPFGDVTIDQLKKHIDRYLPGLSDNLDYITSDPDQRRFLTRSVA